MTVGGRWVGEVERGDLGVEECTVDVALSARTIRDIVIFGLLLSFSVYGVAIWKIHRLRRKFLGIYDALVTQRR